MSHVNLNKLAEGGGDSGQPLYVTFYYTFLEGGWGKMADSFIYQCEGMNLPYMVYHLRWQDFPRVIHGQKNHKRYVNKYNRVIPFLVEDVLSELQTPVMYCHIDSRFRKKPPVECFNDDALFSRGHGSLKSQEQQTRKGLPPRRWHILGSPFYMRPTPPAYDFLRQWQERCIEDLGGSEHGPLKYVYEKVAHKADHISEFSIQMSSRLIDDDPYFYL